MGSIPTPGTKYMTKQVTTAHIDKVTSKECKYFCLEGKWYALTNYDDYLWPVEDAELRDQLTQLAADAAKRLTPYW